MMALLHEVRCEVPSEAQTEACAAVSDGSERRADAPEEFWELQAPCCACAAPAVLRARRERVTH